MSHDNFCTLLLEVWETQSNCDVKFICADPTNSSGKSSIDAHQLILSLNSDVFKAMFFGPLVENKSEFGNPGIDVPDIDFSIFKMVLGFMYGKKVQLENVEMAFEFYYAVHKYNCKDALNFVTQYLSEEIDSENCFFIYQESEKYNNSELKAACLEIFASAAGKIFSSNPFFKADPKTIAVMFELDMLKINSEEDLCAALELYITHNKTYDPEIAVKVRPALKNIRFLTLPAREIARTTLLTPEESECIIESLNSNLTKMPEGFSQRTNKRSPIVLKVQMIRALSDIFYFSSKTCFRCVKSRHHLRDTKHAIWSCSHVTLPERLVLKNIYSKYNHVSLMEYDEADLNTVYDCYKKLKLVD